MGKRATALNLKDRYVVINGEPILDTKEGILIIAFEDGTSRIFNWDNVLDFYYMSEDEYEYMFGDEDESGFK